jgi:hypothetical protein
MIEAFAGTYVCLLLALLVYFKRRFGAYVSARTAVLGWLWVICGPPHLYYLWIGKTPNWLFIRMTIAFMLMFAALVIGIEGVRLMAPRRFRAVERQAREWRHLEIAKPYIPTNLLVLLCTIGALVLLIVSIWERQLINVIAFLSLGGRTNDVAEFRGTVGGSKLYVYNVFLASVGPFLSFLLQLTPSSRHPFIRPLRWIFVALILLGKIALFNRSAAALYIVQLLMLRPLLRDNRIRLFTLLKGLVLVGVLAFPAFYHYLGTIPLGQFISFYLLDRMFLAPYYGMTNYFIWFPEVLPHAMGRNFTIINTLWYGSADYTPAMVRFAQEAGNYFGSFNAAFVAEAWADFSYPGIVVMSLIVGGFAAFADLVIFPGHKRTREGVAILACVVYGVFVLSATAAQTALFSGGLALVPLTALALKTIARVGPRRRLPESPTPVQATP